jgi:hypothetical protein
MDFQFAMYKERNALDVTVTQKNKELYIDKNRAIQVKCLFGFFCSSSSTMEVCPSGHWCPQSTVEPNECDALSVCTEGAGYQVNFLSTLIMIVMALCVFTSSCVLVKRQKKRNNASRLKDPSSVSEEVGTVVRYDNLNSQQRSYVEVSFKDLLFQVPAPKTRGQKDSTKIRDILPRVSGSIPAGKLSVILGPTAW